MDIEGSEYDVIDSILNDNIEVDQILVEFHPHLVQNGRKKKVQLINLKVLDINALQDLIPF
jgi:hypothetical protein